jgi:hypothetical protein
VLAAVSFHVALAPPLIEMAFVTACDALSRRYRRRKTAPPHRIFP